MKRIVILLLSTLLCVQAFPAEPDETDKQKRVLVALATIIDGDTIPTFEMMEFIIGEIYGRILIKNILKTNQPRLFIISIS